ncbi:hypothetical protein Gotur_018380, partial [Gossypium turneri]
TKKKVDIFALSIYGLVVFPRALGHVDEAVTDLFDRLDKRVTQVSVDKVSYQVFSDNYSPLKAIVATPRRDDISEEKWMAIFQNLQRISSGKLHGCFQTRSYIDVEILIGFL